MIHLVNDFNKLLGGEFMKVMSRDGEKVWKRNLSSEVQEIQKFRKSNPLKIFKEENPVDLKKYSQKCALCHSEKDTVSYKKRYICRSCIELIKTGL